MIKRMLVVAAYVGVLGYGWSVAQADGPPAGPYQKSCTKCSVNRKMDTLFCTCQKADHSATNASLRKVSACKQDINNCNGTLTCGPC